MARKPLKQPISAPHGKCCECKHSYDYHELTNYEPRKPFLCRCPYEKWSQFLDKQCVNGQFQRK
ncbi:MAG: hypothetical protein IJ760_07640 [Bacteroidales bacterium]|nr:hypothetical protein [Bacteroidales bacterium]